jgi:hypothetical protein
MGSLHCSSVGIIDGKVKKGKAKFISVLNEVFKHHAMKAYVKVEV